MAEYYTVLKRAVSGPEMGVAEARRAVYDKARNALIGQLKAVEPPLTTAEISRQRLELEEAIRRVERETASGVGTAPATTTMSRPAPVAERPPPPPPSPPAPTPMETEEAITPAQDVFRRAMQDAGVRGAENAVRVERTVPPPGRPPAPPVAPARRPTAERIPYRQPPPPEPEPEEEYAEPQDYDVEPAYAEAPQRGAASEPRLAPDYEQDWYRGGRQRGAAAGPPAPPVVERRGRGKRNAAAEQEAADAPEPRVRKSRLPGILLLVLIIGVLGGIGALAYSQRAVINDLFASFESSTGSVAGSSSAPPAATSPATPPVVDSGKNADRLLEGAAPAPRDVRVVSPGGAPAPLPTTEPLPTSAPAGGAVVAAPPPTVAPPAAGGGGATQKAVLYEEPLDGSANGVVAIGGAATWRFIEDGPNGPELEATLDVPERGMKVRFSLHKNSDSTLPASHLVEVVVDTPAGFPGGSVRSVPRIVLKPTEEARGQPLVGAAAKVADGFFWVALSAAPNDVADNLALLRERNWIDLPLVYENGQRAIITFEKGAPGEQVFARAIAAWSPG